MPPRFVSHRRTPACKSSANGKCPTVSSPPSARSRLDSFLAISHNSLPAQPGFSSGRRAVSVVAVAQLVESRIVIPVVVGSSPIGHPTKSRVPGWVPCNPFSLFGCVPAMQGLPLNPRRSAWSHGRRPVHRGPVGGIVGLASREACVQYLTPAGAKLAIAGGKQASVPLLEGLLAFPSLPGRRRQRVTT